MIRPPLRGFLNTAPGVSRSGPHGGAACRYADEPCTDAKYPALIDEILGSAEIATVPTGVQMPRMNSIIERWVKTLRGEMLDRTLIWNQTHLRHALREYERHYNEHRTHRSLAAAASLRARPQPLEPDHIERLTVDRQDGLGGVIHEYHYAA